MTAKERPILFSGPMVRAILEGRKTQTRRIVKPQPPAGHISPVCENGWWMWQRFVADRRHFDGKTTEKTWDSLCPYGQPGDRLWVRETHLFMPSDSHEIMYADHEDYDVCYPTKGSKFDLGWRVRSAIHMPRLASRITLEITGVRVERLQDISQEDARAEGIETNDLCPLPIGNFRALWDTINAKRAPWASNPWVWVIEFKRVTP